MRLLVDAQRPLLTNDFAEYSDAMASAFDGVDSASLTAASSSSTGDVRVPIFGTVSAM